MRQEFPGKIKLAAFERSKGHCEKCKARVIGRAEYDHILPDWLGGEPTLDNCMVMCSKCHRAKTSGEDVPRIAKAKRQRAKHIGASTTKRPMQGSRASGFKRKISGEVVKR